MPSISSCPACHRDLTIPDLANGQTSLRCPLCEVRFTAEQVLADCVPFPPLAIVLEAEEPPGATTEMEGPQYLPADDMPDTAAMRAGPKAQRQPVDSEAAAASAEALHEHPLTTEAEFDDEPDEMAAATADDGEFERQVSAMRVAPRVRRQTSPLAMLGQFAGIVIGGVLGLAVGYWVLLWLGGSKVDVLELRGKLPRWVRPPARRHDAGLRMPLAKVQQQDDSRPARDFVDQAAWPSPSGATAEQALSADDGTNMPLQSVPAGGQTEPLLSLDTERGAVAAPDPAPNVPPAGYLGPREFQARTAGELRAAIEQTELALRCPRCKMPGAVRLVSFESAAGNLPGGPTAPPCDACRGKPVVHLGTAGFAQLCELGEAVTFVQFADDNAPREQLRDTAEAILMALGNQRDKRETIGRLAGARLQDAKRPGNGVVIAGTVEEARPLGDLFAIRIILASCGKHVEVVSRQSPEPALKRRDHAIMLGSIVDRPKDNLAGYTGDAPQIIWGGLHLKVSQ